MGNSSFEGILNEIVINLEVLGFAMELRNEKGRRKL